MSSPTTRTHRLVVKVGTAVISRPSGGLNKSRLRSLAAELSTLQRKGYGVLLVSSGAIGAGMDRFGWKERPTHLRDKQAAAAVGQVVLMEAFENAFRAHNITVAQMLLTQGDLEDRSRYLNARHTMTALLERGVIPIINENDTVSTQEIQFGDNDSLAASVAVKMDAKSLFLLTDVDGLLSGSEQDARLLPEVFQITPDIETLVRGTRGSHKSVGGMASKIQAARLAMESGVEVWIASGKESGVMADLLKGQGVGTRFQPRPARVNSRRRWIAFGRRPRGGVVVDAGAVRAIVTNKKSLLPSGVLEVEGTFGVGDTVRVLDPERREVARGLSALTSQEMVKVRGKKTSEMEKVLRRSAPAEIIHRNNLVVTA